MKILVRATNWIGDAIMSLPAVRLLRSRYPNAEICVLSRASAADLYAGERSIDRVIPLAGRPGARDLKEKWKLAAALRKERFDLAVLLPNSFESAAMVWLGRANRRVGYARDGRGFLLTQAIATPKSGEIPRHERYYYPELLRRAGIIDAIPEIGSIRLDGVAEAAARGRKLLAERGIGPEAIGVSPGAAYGTAKRWLPERFAEAARRLAERFGGTVVVFGSGSERALCEQVAAACGGVSLAGATSLREFIDMTAACRVFLTNDSGAMHVAAALEVPSVTVFGPTDETGTGPSGPKARLVREPVDCAPCKLRECPIDHRCMTGVTTDMVAAEAIRAVHSSVDGC